MSREKVFRVFFFCLVGLLIGFLWLFPVKGATKQIYRISIETVEEEGVTGGMIDRGLVPYIRRVLEEAADADAIILEINTHGGLVDSAVKIRDIVLDSKVRTIAFIRRAISAGALIALATDDIVMSSDATIGAATPIQAGAGGQAQAVEEKFMSYFRAEFRATAEATGRNADIAEAMVDANREIPNPRFKFTPQSLEDLQEDLEEDEVEPDIAEKIVKDLTPLVDQEFSKEEEFLEAVEEEIGQKQRDEYEELILKSAKVWFSKKGELLTLTTRQALDNTIRIAEYEASTIEEVLQRVATSITLTSRSLENLRNDGVPENISEALRPLLDQEFTRKTEFLNSVAQRLQYAQFSRYQEPIWNHAEKLFAFEEITESQIQTTELNWAEQLVRFLTNPYVSSLLLMVGFLGLYLEFKTPGFGVGGTLGLIGLGLFFWGHFLVRLAGWEELILFIVGVILLLVEILIIPGFGVVGILGIIAILTSLALSMVGRFELLTFQDIQGALSKLTAALIGSIILAIVLMKFFPRTSVGKQVILKNRAESDEGYVAQAADRSHLIGMTGVTLTPLHPSGTMFLSETRYDVVSEGDFIEKNIQVKVINVEGARIVVRKVDESN